MTTKLVKYSKLTYHEDFSQSKEDWFERPGGDEHIQYSREIGERFLIDNGFEHILNRLLCLKRIPKSVGLYNNVIEGLFSVGLHAGVDELKATLSSIHLPSENGGFMYVPKSMNQFLDMDANGIGKGEIALMLLSADDIVHNPSERYDVSINGSFWHMKDCRKYKACRMGKPIGSVNDKHCFDAPIFKFFISLRTKCGLTPDFGVEFFETELVKKELLKRYDTTDIVFAAKKAEDEFDAFIQSSVDFGDATGIIQLVHSDKKTCFQRINKEHVHFYSMTQRGTIKITSTPNRFVDAVKVENKK